MNKPLECKRRTLFIQRAFQGRFIAWMVGLILVFALFSAGILYLLLASDLQAETRSAHLRIADVWSKLGTSIVLGNVVSAVMSGILVVIVVLYLSHKIAGPMFRFARIFAEIGSGNLDVSVSLRDGDQLKDLALALDQLLSALRQQRERRLQGVADARAMLAELRQLGEGATQEEVAARLDRIDARLKSLAGEEQVPGDGG